MPHKQKPTQGRYGREWRDGKAPDQFCAPSNLLPNTASPCQTTRCTGLKPCSTLRWRSSIQRYRYPSKGCETVIP